ncbi:hypothetical protein AXF42_Ash017637 [Apostasia shenzhenica]|uniref:Oxidation resistance protein 1 n=1 Tax=Apostasia shenzhenica TaxID=1088818 RepID=A0A2I0A5D3_9ASPA|nr:hypothetical protein AXF42_Ash017637 [Apostasia shenzhenica]
MGYLPSSSFRRKAAHLVSDLTTVILNPISDKPSGRREENGMTDTEKPDSGKDSELPDEPDTSSFTAFLVSLLSSTDSGDHLAKESKDQYVEGETILGSAPKEHSGRKGLLSRGKQSVGKAVQRIARIAGYRHNSEPKVDNAKENDTVHVCFEPCPVMTQDDNKKLLQLPDISEPSSIMSEDMRKFLYFSLPIVAQGRNWMLLYSTWRHGISLSTLYRKSLLWPGYCLLVIGDQKGVVFGGLVEAPLRPTNKRYQGTNSCFVFTNASNKPIIFRPTGANHYFTLCSTDYFAMGGGGHFALYLDGDLLSGSSYESETFGNSCLANSEDFKVKEVELWGFVYASKYEEMLNSSRELRNGISSC